MEAVLYVGPACTSLVFVSFLKIFTACPKKNILDLLKTSDHTNMTSIKKHVFGMGYLSKKYVGDEIIR